MFGLFETSILSVAAVANGGLHSIDKSTDPAFSQKMMGDGYVIFPTSGDIVAPVDGKVEMLFPTMHAIGITSKEGIEILLHLGIDTVNLEGKGFQPHVKIGDVIEQGQLLMKMDLQYINEHAPSSEILCIFTGGQKCRILKETEVSAGQVNIVKITQ